MTVVIIIVGIGPLDPIEFGLDSGDGFVFSMLADDDGDGRIKTLVPFHSTMAIGIDHGVAGGSAVEDCILWDFTGSDVHEPLLPYEVPLFTNTADGSLGTDYGILLPPPTSFSPGQILPVTDGTLAEWGAPRFIDDSGATGLSDFVALRDSLPNFVGNVTVSNFHIRVQAVPEPATFVLLLTLLLFGVVCLRLPF